MAALLPSPAT